MKLMPLPLRAAAPAMPSRQSASRRNGLTTFLLLILLTLPLHADAQAGIDWENWHRGSEAKLQEITRLPQDQQITGLGSVVISGARDPVRQLNRWQSDIFSQAKAGLLGIPGASEYYGDRINRSHAAFKGTILGERQDGSTNEVQREMINGFRVLANLPSPETVRVLGEMLSDEWEGPMPEGADYWPDSLAVSAVLPLARLPFTDPPAPDFPDHAAKENLKAWQQWYAEVKAGTRSFAFIGQPVSHRFGPDGTVETTPRDASADPPEFPQESAAMENPRVAVEKKPAQSPSAPAWWWTAGVAVMAAIALLLRKRMSGHPATTGQ